jgi:hypothetical protein
MPPSHRVSTLVLLSALGSLILMSAPRRALCQTATAASAADKEAARNLYIQGFSQQQAGNFTDALERFKRAQAVYPAPTTQLHIAECEAQLGHLVEAAEAYRALTRQQLAADANPAFVAAQTQAAAELQQVEPRIPHVHIDIAPHNIQGLNVTIDDQPMNVALLDVDRPVDPGTHKIVVVAPGYDRAEATVVIKEREPTKQIVIPMRPGGAVVVPVAVLPPTNVQTAPAYAVPPDVPLYIPPEWHSRTGLFMGPRLGYLLPEGVSDVTDAVGGGFSLGGELDLRFARRLFFGVVADHGFLKVKDTQFLTSAATTDLGVTFGVITNPDHFAGLFQIGVAYRLLTLNANVGLLDESNPGQTLAQTVHSVEGMLGAGFWIPIGQHVRLVPRVDLGFGSFDLSNTALEEGSSSTYAFVNFNLAGYYNLDFGSPPSAPAAHSVK